MVKVLDIDTQMQLIKRGAVEIISETELREKIDQAIKKNKPLIVKAGFDPSAPDIHLGHTVLLRKLRHLQELGHRVIFLIGDATALIGDPSGQSTARKVLTINEVNKNAETYETQVGRILNVKDEKTFERRHNSEWFLQIVKRGREEKPFNFPQFIDLAQKYTVARLLERDDFQKRLKENRPISFLELFYPLMQGYDSVRLEADIEIGGTDQKFNMLVGRDLQEAYGQKPQVVITMPLLEGTDGLQKMSKTYGNYIGINEPAKEMFGKLMSISDAMMMKYYELLTEIDLSSLKDMHPMEAKKNLGYEIVQQYHSVKEAKRAQDHFEKTFQQQDPFKDMNAQEFALEEEEDFLLVNFLCSSVGLNWLKSKSEFRRLLNQDAVEVNGERIKDCLFKLQPHKEYRIKVGKIRFSKIILRELK